jgi:hypothetical protein
MLKEPATLLRHAGDAARPSVTMRTGRPWTSRSSFGQR